MPTRLRRVARAACLVATLGAAAGAGAAGTDELDALSLESAPQAETPPAARPFRLFVEGALGHASRRYGLDDETLARASLDLYWAPRFGDQWRAVLSNRLDYLDPAEPGWPNTVNSLREASVGWQDAAAELGFDAGRVNYRLGPAYGFNPTDYFRDGSLRIVTSADPLSWRDNRMGTVMLRGQMLRGGWAATGVLAPKLDDERSTASYSLDLGATNHADRALLVVSSPTVGSTSGQGTLFYERGKGWQAGANATTLLNDATVGFVEWSGGRDVVWQPATDRDELPVRTGNRLAAGLTYTTPTRATLTLEYEYNGFAADPALWESNPVDGPRILGEYLSWALGRQDIAPKRAVLLYATQDGLLSKRLDLSGFLKWNADDGSRFLWLEARYRWPRVDLALQVQRADGSALSEFGAFVNRQVIQVVTAVYF
jgi:hypothetical protein